MEPKTLKHHRKTDNKYSFAFGRQTITVTRRFLPSGAVRVRVTSATLSGTGEGNWTDYRDFPDMHDGDAAYSKQAVRWCRKWEERYIDTPKKETTVQDPTPEPTETQEAAGYTATPAQAAEIATRRTGVRHVVAEDGRTVCRRPATEPPATIEHQVPDGAPVTLSAKGRKAVDGHIAGRVLGEYTVRFKGPRRMGRSDAMLALLKAQTAHLHAADMAAHARRVATRTGHPATEQAANEKVADLQVKATYFRALRDAGYAADTTWDELIEMLRPIVSTALHGLDDQRAALARVNTTGQVSIRRSIDAAEAFLEACKPVLSFFQPDEEDEDGDCPDCGTTRDEDEATGEARCPNGCDDL